jgi:3-oxoacyl-[acyl-carrier protein] reductase
MTAPLSGRAVLVTGASSGIGRAIALAVARAGADVALTYRTSAAEAQAVARDIRAMDRRAVALQLDLADEPSIRDLGAAARHALGRLDVWVNNAGADILTGPAAALSTLQKLDLLLAIDLRGTMIASWAAAELFRAQPEGGSIINISWDHVLTGMPGINPQMFAAVKGGVHAFSKSLARSVAPKVRVNVVAPGWIDTEFAAGLDNERRAAVAESTPLGRWGTPDDVAGAVSYLASPAAAFLTGQTILVNGGVVM